MYIKIKVIAGAKKENIQKKNNDTFIISVKEPAERNLANKRICEIIAKEYAIKNNSVRIISGHQSSSKILSISLPAN